MDLSCHKIAFSSHDWVAYETLETAQNPNSIFYLTLGLDFGLGLGLVNSSQRSYMRNLNKSSYFRVKLKRIKFGL